MDGEMGNPQAEIAPADVSAFARSYFERLYTLLENLDFSALASVIAAIERAHEQGQTLFLIGNGGSAATASHMAQDLAFGTRRRGGERIRALSLTDNHSYISACANDLGFEQVFVDQLKSLLQPGDVLIAISASGNSPNLVKAIEYARAHGAFTIGFVGFDGGWMKDHCELVVHTPSPPNDYGPVEDVHLILDHLIMSYLNEAE
jgi:D-sedoheptulose 7-phosphate isomerase